MTNIFKNGNASWQFQSPWGIALTLVVLAFTIPEVIALYYFAAEYDLTQPVIVIVGVGLAFYLGSLQGRAQNPQQPVSGSTSPPFHFPSRDHSARNSVSTTRDSNYSKKSLTPPAKHGNRGSPLASTLAPASDTGRLSDVSDADDKAQDTGRLSAPGSATHGYRRSASSQSGTSNPYVTVPSRKNSVVSSAQYTPRGSSTQPARKIDRTGQIVGMLMEDANSPRPESAWTKTLEEIKVANPGEPTKTMFEQVILGAGSAKQWQVINQVMTTYYAGDLHPDKSPVTVALAITELAANHRWREALDLLDKLKQLINDDSAIDKRVEDKSELLKYAYPAVVDACVSCGEVQVANDLLLELESQNFPMTESGPYNSAIIAFAGGRQWQAALNLLDRMRSVYSFTPHLFAVNSIINSLGRAGLWEQSVDMLHHMKDFGVEPDLVSYNTAIASCVPARQWQMALELLAEARNIGIHVNTITYNSAISACGASREWRSSLALLKEMRAAGIQPNLRTYGAVVMACKVSRHWEGVHEIFDAMMADGINPDETIYQNLIGIACSCRSPDEAIKLHEAMVLSGMKPDAATLNRLVTVCARAGSHTDVEKFIKLMKERNIAPDSVTRKAVQEENFGNEDIKERLTELLGPDYEGNTPSRPPVWSKDGTPGSRGTMMAHSTASLRNAGRGSYSKPSPGNYQSSHSYGSLASPGPNAWKTNTPGGALAQGKRPPTSHPSMLGHQAPPMGKSDDRFLTARNSTGSTKKSPRPSPKNQK